LKQSRIVAFTKWFVFLTYCLSVLGGENGLVLCLRSNGHVAIEKVCNGYTDQSANAISQTSFHPSSKEAIPLTKDYCGVCVDIPLSILSIVPHSSAQKPLLQYQLQIYPSVLKQWSMFGNNLKGVIPPFLPFMTNSTIRAGRSIVLLI
jgi:hypothetical protein